MREMRLSDVGKAEDLIFHSGQFFAHPEVESQCRPGHKGAFLRTGGWFISVFPTLEPGQCSVFFQMKGI